MKSYHPYIACFLGLFFLAGTLPPSSFFQEEKREIVRITEEIPGPEADSLQEHIMRMHEKAICTLERLLKSYQSRIWMAADSSVEARMAAWNAHPDIPKWMGKLKQAADSVIMIEFSERLLSMHERLVNKEISYEVKSTWLSYCQFTSTNAFVRKGSDSRTIFLCPEWFDKKERQQVATILHELVHTFGFSHPLNTDTPLEAVALAKAHPALAIQSPENYESLAELYVCQEKRKL